MAGEAWESRIFAHKTPHPAEQEAPTHLPPPSPRERALVTSPRSLPRPGPPRPSLAADPVYTPGGMRGGDSESLGTSAPYRQAETDTA